MAFDFQHKFPEDTLKKGIGINIPFSESNVFSSNYKTADALKNNIINYFLTNPGERYDNPEFGGGLRKFLFEQLTNENVNFLREDIQQKFNKYFSGVVVGNIDIITNEDNPNQLDISIKYSIPNTNIKDQIELKFN